MYIFQTESDGIKRPLSAGDANTPLGRRSKSCDQYYSESEMELEEYHSLPYGDCCLLLKYTIPLFLSPLQCLCMNYKQTLKCLAYAVIAYSLPMVLKIIFGKNLKAIVIMLVTKSSFHTCIAQNVIGSI